jgi:monoamine oxidase
MSHDAVDRRGFLRNAVAGTAGALGGAAVLPHRAEAASNQADIIVIGAGMAGVTTARTVHDGGNRVIVLEGRPDRIGGRIWTSRAWGDVPLDLGASWLTHETINPLADIAKAYGVKTVPSELLDLSLREANGQVLSDDQVTELFGLYSATYAAVKTIALARSAQGLPDIPASTAFTQVAAAERLDMDTRRRLGFFLDYAIQTPECADLYQLSLNEWDNNYVYTQIFTSIFPQGYDQLVRILGAPLDIRLDHVVREIHQDPRGVSVVTNHGTFRAAHVVVTLPHAVLASNAVKFTPALPAWKRGAISRLKTGLTDKLYLRFPTRFWDPTPTTLGRIPPTLNSGWSTWLNFYKYTGIPILMVFNHTGLAQQLERMSDTQVLDAAMSVLRGAYGSSIPDPIAMQRSRWGADPFARGTFPHVAPGGTTQDYALMGQSFGRVRFAGDSTDPDFPNLVFGAFRSGVREGIILNAGLA